MKLQDEIKINQEQRVKASKTGDVEKTMHYVGKVQELERRKQAIMDVITNLDVGLFYTDTEVIEVANSVLAIWNDVLAGLNEKWDSAMTAFCNITEEICKAKQMAYDELIAVLAYHSISRDGKTSQGNWPDSLKGQGLNTIRTIPNMAYVHSLLRLRFGEMANAMVTISNDGYVPNYT